MMWSSSCRSWAFVTAVYLAFFVLSCDEPAVDQVENDGGRTSIIGAAGTIPSFCGHFRKIKGHFDKLSDRMRCESLQNDYLEDPDRRVGFSDKNTCCECFFPGSMCPYGQVLLDRSRCEILNDDYRNQIEQAIQNGVSAIYCPEPSIKDIGTCCVEDHCPDDPGKLEPGECGCGALDVDADKDGTADCADSCPEDPNKIEPGDCGCGEAEGYCEFDILGTSTIQGGTDGIGVDLVIVAEGFSADEMASFRLEAEKIVEYMMTYSPEFAAKRHDWNVHLIELVSNESGADRAGTLVDTALDAHFDCGGITRLLCVDRLATNRVVNQYFPQYDIILVLVNSTQYGGSGGPVSVASLRGGADVALHELGHSFAGLADEYGGNRSAPTVEPNQPNVTINSDINTVKWAKHVGTGFGDVEVGLFEGGRYVYEGVFRPTYRSIMRSLRQPFGAVNQEAWDKAVDLHVRSARTQTSSDGTLIATVEFKEGAYRLVSVERTKRSIPPLLHSVEMAGDLLFETTTNQGDAVGERYRIPDPRILRVPFEDPQSRIEGQDRTETHPVILQKHGYFSVRLPYHPGAEFLELVDVSDQTAKRIRKSSARHHIGPLWRADPGDRVG